MTKLHLRNLVSAFGFPVGLSPRSSPAFLASFLIRPPSEVSVLSRYQRKMGLFVSKSLSIMTHPVVVKPPLEIYQYDRFGVCSFWKYATRSAQPRPFNIPTELYMAVGTSSRSHGGSGTYGAVPAANSINSHYPSISIIEDLASKSFDRMKDAAYSKAELGLNIVEYEQSLSMIVKTAGTLLRTAQAIRKGNFVSAARILRQRFVPKGVSKAKSFGNNWLEYHFGWKPLLGDIHDAVEVVTNPLQTAQVSKGSARYNWSDDQNWDFNYGSGYSSESSSTSIRQHIIIGGVKDPALFSLEQLGLNNPLALAWEAVPYSFVIDWFANVGNVLSSYTAFSGLEILSSGHSIKHRYNGSWTFNSKVSDYVGVSGSAEYVSVERRLNYKGPSFGVKPIKPPSAERGATAISLLLQQLRR